MSTEILMPALSPTMTEGKLARWLKKEGDQIKSGMVLAEIETDKATMEVEAVDEGLLSAILIPEGTEGVKVNTPIARLQGDDEEAAPKEANGHAPEKTNGTTHAEAPFVNPTCRPAPPAASATPAAQYVEREYTSFIKQTVRESLRDAMAEEMRRDNTVFVMGEEVAEYQGAYKVTQGLLQEFGDKRVIDTPITEHGFAGLGVGAAFSGLKPVVEFMTMNFGMQAMDQIINSAAKTNYMSGGQMGCPIVFRGPNGAASRVSSQHSQCFASWYAHVPGLKVVAPYSGADCKGLLKAAIRDPNPIIFLENELMYGQSFDVPDDPDFILPIGKALVMREGKDVTITAFSIMVGKALQAAEELAAEGIEAEVINLRTLRPLDTETIVQSVQKTNRLVSVEEGWPTAGIGSEIAALMMEQAFDYLDAPVTRVCAADVPLPYAANLEKLALPQVADIVAAVKRSVINNLETPKPRNIKMPVNILMPALSPTMTEGNLAKWIKKEGDKVKPGMVIAEIETDKATMEVEAVDEGVIGKIIVPAGTQGVKVNQLIAVLLEEGEKLPADFSAAPAAAAPKAVSETPQPRNPATPQPSSAPQNLRTSEASSRIFASPLAKRIAEQNNVNLKNVAGTGPNGRIVKEDVEKAMANKGGASAPAAAPQGMNAIDYANKLGQPYELIPNSTTRKVIAKRLTESKQTVPHFYLSVDCKIDRLLELRKQLNETTEAKVSVNDFIIRAVAVAMRQVPAANASWAEEGVLMYKNVDVSVAVAGPQGLITPIIPKADQKSVQQISSEMKDLAKRAREGTLKPTEFMGGGFTVSNLGMFGISNFAAIINPPQACILAVGAGEQRPIVKDGEITIATMMSCTLSVDHRVVDGAIGAEFLTTFKKLIEEPIRLFV